MSKTKNKPGIHLHKTSRRVSELGINQWEYYWNIIASNGRIIARSSQTYSRKAGAVKSIKVVASLFYFQFQDNGKPAYYDHSKKDSPLQSYL
jgi:hypothetical protein